MEEYTPIVHESHESGEDLDSFSLLEDCEGIEPFNIPTWIPNLKIADDLKTARMVATKS
jgi:hypothetical protein